MNVGVSGRLSIRVTLFASVLASSFSCAVAQTPRIRPMQVRAPQPGSKVPAIAVSNGPRIWKTMAFSRGLRPIQGMQTGKGDFRVLILGSLKGSDPSATTLVDQLAVRMTNNADIIGGFESTIIRSPNPDGIALRRPTNHANVAIATAFPRSGVAQKRKSEPEVTFLRRFIKDQNPDRVLHITSGSTQKPLVLFNDRSKEIAGELASWVDADTKPTSRFAPNGSLEHYLGESTELLTLVLPRNAKPNEVWSKYGDSLFATLALGTKIEAWPLPTASKPKIYPSTRQIVEELPPPPGRRRP